LRKQNKTIFSRPIKISELQANVDKLGQLTEKLFGLNSETSILCQHRHQSHKFSEWPLSVTESKYMGIRQIMETMKVLRNDLFVAIFCIYF
jgi:hypothetical protein